MTPKPKPPSESQVADELAACLAALGARTGPPLGERVLAWFREAWRGRSLDRPPRVIDCAVGIGETLYSVRDELRRLEAAGRMLHPTRGAWVPRQA